MFSEHGFLNQHYRQLHSNEKDTLGKKYSTRIWEIVVTTAKSCLTELSG